MLTQAGIRMAGPWAPAFYGFQQAEKKRLPLYESSVYPCTRVAPNMHERSAYASYGFQQTGN